MIRRRKGDQTPARRNPNRKAIRDMLVISALLIAAFVFFQSTEFANLIVTAPGHPEWLRADGLILFGLVALVLMGWYGYRRWRDVVRAEAVSSDFEAQLAESAVRIAAERTLRSSQRPVWDFGEAVPEQCERNVRMMTAAMINLGDVILAGPGAQEDKAAQEISAALDDLKVNLEKAMLQTCRTCLAETGRLEPVNATSDETSRRRRFLLRLVTSKVSQHFASERTHGQGLSRDMVVGLEIFMRQTLGDILYDRLDQESREIQQEIPSDVDADIWSHLIAERRYRNYSLRLLMRMIADFREFEHGRSHFVTLIGKHQGAAATGRGARIEFTDADFVQVFAAVFGELFEFVESEENRIWLDYLCGEGSAALVQNVYRQFVQMIGRLESGPEGELILQDSA